MRSKKVLSLALAILLLMTAFTALAVTPVCAAGKVTPKRAIAIVYDNSGSMYMYKNKAWCQALYAIEVFATMMNPGDKLMVYPMNPMGPEGETPIYNRNNPLVITDDSQKSIIHTLKSDLRNGNNNTPIEPIDSANAGLKKESADEKWLVLLTDGAVFYENGIAFGSSKQTRVALEERFKKYISDSNILYLGIGTGLDAPQISSSGAHIYAARTAASEKVPTVLTEMCNMIFGRDTLPKNHMSSSSIDFDIPLSKLYIFIQGDGIDNVKLMKDGKELKPSQTFTPTHSTAGGISDFKEENNFAIDTTLKGYIASYNDLEKGTYNYSYSGKASSTAFYYEVDADLVLTFRNESGEVITNADEVTPGDYALEYALVDKDGNVLKSDLLGKIDFELQYAINGKNKVESSKNSSGQMSVHIDENTEFALTSAEVNFLSGYRIQKTGGELGFLAIPFKGVKGAAKALELKLSGGANETDADLVSDVPPYTVTVKYDGKQLSGSELDSVQFTAEISGSGIKLDVKQTDSGYEIKLVPEDGLKVVPTGDYTIEVKALISSETVADSSDSASAKLRVKEVSDRLGLELSYSSTVYSTLDGKAPEIIANVKYNGQKLTAEQFEKLDFTAEADGLDLIVKPLPDKSAYYITLNTESDIEKGEYPISIKATGITGRDGEMLTATGEVGVRVQLLPQWLVMLLWLLLILLIILLIWLWLRTPVLPKVIDLAEGSIRVSIDGEEQRVLTATVDYPKSGKRRTVTIEASPGALSNVYISATLVPAKESYRYLPSSRRRALVVSDSIDASRNVNTISMGNVRFSRDDKNALQRRPAGTEDFEFPTARINFSGVKSIHGRNTDFSITGNIVFRDRR